MLNNLDFLKKFDTSKEFKVPFLKSNFEDNIWILELNKIKKNNTVIDFNISLKDGFSLTHPKNYTTLYTFKKLILNLFLNNDMYLNAESTILQSLNHVLHLFNLMNFYDDGLFAKHGFKGLDKNQLLFLINKRAENNYLFDMYSGYERLIALLEKENINLPKDITEHDVFSIEKKLKNKNINLQKELFPNIFIGVQFSLSDILLNKTDRVKYLREFPSHFRNNDSSSVALKSIISKFLIGVTFLVKMHSEKDKNLNLPFKSDLEYVLNYNFQNKDIKHFETYPVESIFKTMKDCLDFHFQYGESLTNAFSLFLQKVKENNLSETKLDLHQNKLNKKLTDDFVIDCIDQKLLNLGVNSYYNYTDQNYFINLRKNTSLFSLLKVYYGCVQFVVGALMARRQSELSSMETNCFDEINLQLNFRKSKSHIHNFGIRDYISLPTSEIVIEMLKNINSIAKQLNHDGVPKIFNAPQAFNPFYPVIHKANKYENLDLMFDYFEVDLIEGKRPYIRQHQLRRFFAMAFFWSKGFKSIDTLRWFLGHTNAEHVYHYIQENLDGHILNNVKAQYITENISSYSNIKEVIKEIFGIDNYSLIDKNDLSDYINTLLEDKLITVEPEFLEDDKNNQFEIIVKVKNHG